MRKLFISTMALIIGFAFTSGSFAEMEGMEAAPAEKQNTQMGQTEPAKESKRVDTKSASKKKMKKEKKGKKAKKEMESTN